MTHQKTKQQVLTLENKEQKEGKQYFWRKEWNLKKTEFQEGTCDGLVSHSGGSYNIPSSFKLKELQNFSWTGHFAQVQTLPFYKYGGCETLITVSI